MVGFEDVDAVAVDWLGFLNAERACGGCWPNEVLPVIVLFDAGCPKVLDAGAC